MACSVGQLCQDKSIDIRELADRSGLEEGRVAAIALGRWTPSPSERRGIAKALEVDVDQIAWGHATPIQHLYGHGPG